MTRRAFRVLLFLLLLGTAALAGYQGWRLETARLRQLASANAFDTLSLRLAQSVVDLRAAERAYVSSGQGFAWWKPRVDALLQQIRQDLTTLKSAPTAPPGTDVAVDAAAEALSEVTRLERRIADAAEAGRIQFAADIVFADGLQASLALERAVDGAILASKADLAAYQREARIQELILAAVSACIGLFLALMWFPSQKRPAPVQSVSTTSTLGLDLPLKVDTSPEVSGSAATTAPNAAPIPAAAIIKKDSAAAGSAGSTAGAGVSAVRRDSAAPGAAGAGVSAARKDAAAAVAAVRAAKPEVPAPPPSSAIAAAPPQPPPAADGTRLALIAAADLVTSFARVTDPGELGGLVAQMSRQLDAAGVIVWLVDAQGLSLRPALSHGYPAEALSRLGRLELTSDNATARAFRLNRPQTVAGKDSSPGALVVPITSGAGCVGAVAAELRQGREQDAGTLALARIFAAQLALLTGPAASGQAAPAGSAASQS